jgi:hypothetical protein
MEKRDRRAFASSCAGHDPLPDQPRLGVPLATVRPAAPELPPTITQVIVFPAYLLEKK